MSCKKAIHTLTCHLIVSLSSPHSSALLPTPTNTHSHWLGGERILKTNKQRIDLLRRITEVLITSDPSPLLSKSAPLSSLVVSSIYMSTLIPPPLCHFVNLCAHAWYFLPEFICHNHVSWGVFSFKKCRSPNRSS